MFQEPLTGVMLKFVSDSLLALTVGATIPEPTCGPTDDGLFEQVNEPM